LSKINLSVNRAVVQCLAFAVGSRMSAFSQQKKAAICERSERFDWKRGHMDLGAQNFLPSYNGRALALKYARNSNEEETP
jgi:hypothetical protein